MVRVNPFVNVYTNVTKVCDLISCFKSKNLHIMQFFTFNNISSPFNMFWLQVHINVLSSILPNIFSVTYLPSTFCIVCKSDKPGDVNFWGEYQVHQKFVLSQCLLEVNNLWLLLTLTKNEGDIQPEFQVILNFCCTAKCAAFIFASAAVSHCPIIQFCFLRVELRLTFNKSLDWQF